MRLASGHWFHLAIAAGAVLYVAAAVVRVFHGHDPSMYLGLATSIVDGEGYAVDGRPHSQYPPGLPVMLAAIHALGGDQLLMQRVLALLGPISALLVFVWLRGHPHRVAVSLLCLGSAELFQQSIVGLRSEPMFLAVTVGLFCLTRHSERIGVVRWLLVALVAAIVVGTRSVGVAAIAAAVATLLQRLIKRGEGDRTPTSLLVAVIVGGVLAAIAWWTWTSRHSAPLYEGDMHYSYGAQFRLLDPHNPDLGLATGADVLLRVPGLLQIQLGHVAELLCNIEWLAPLIGSPLILGAVFLASLGILRTILHGEAFAGWYVLALGGAISLWPYDEGTRFVLPTLPWLLLFVIDGARLCASWWKSATPQLRRRTLVTVGLIGGSVCGLEFLLAEKAIGRQGQANLAVWVMILLTGLGMWVLPKPVRLPPARWIVVLAAVGYASLGIRSAWRTWSAESTPAVAANRLGGMEGATAWLKANAPAGSSVMCEQYAGVHLSTGLHSMPIPRTGKVDILRPNLLENRPDYLIIQDEIEHAYYLPTEEQRFEILESLFPGAFRLVEDYPGGKILRCRFDQ